MTEHVGVQRAAPYPFDHWPVSHLLSTSNALGERAFTDRPHYALRQGSRCHALKIRSWPSPLEAASSRFAEYAGLSGVGVAAVPSLAAVRMAVTGGTQAYTTVDRSRSSQPRSSLPNAGPGIAESAGVSGY
jgi:hypothetical protein